MINIFQFASNDQSLIYLSKIFGYMNGVIPIPSTSSTIGVSPSGASISLLGTMFKTFNGFILAVGTLVVIYTTVVGVMQTAYEGEFMGKKWNNIWIPIRTVLGIAALVPTGSGYSYIQIIMMWVIVQGIGAADTLWTTVLQYVNLIGSPYATMTVPTVGTYQAMSQLFQGMTCDQTMRFDPSDKNYIPSQGKYYCHSNGCSGDTTSFPASSTLNNSGTYDFKMGPGGKCGALTYCNQEQDCSDASSLKCLACKAQVQALETVIPILTNIANKFVVSDYQYRDFFYNSENTKNANNANWNWIYSYCRAKGVTGNCCVNNSGNSPNCQAPGGEIFPYPNAGSSSNQTWTDLNTDAVSDIVWVYAMQPTYGNTDFIGGAVSEYQNQLTQVITNYIATQQQLSSNSINAVYQTGPAARSLQTAQQTGWILAGSYYYDIANMNSNNLKDAMPTLTVQATDPSTQSTDYSNYRINFSAAEALMSAASGNTQSEYAQIPNASGFGTALGAAGANIQATFSDNVKSDNPLYQLAIAGSVLLTIAEVLFGVIVGLSIALGFAGGLNFIWLGNGLTQNPMQFPIMLVYFIVLPALIGLFGLLISLGGMLGIYVPLIPYILYTFGAIGWMISTVEAMVAGPLVALGILSPSGQHELLGKAEPALMLLFNIFLRPSLMIFGMMAAMLLASVVVKMINAAFYTVMTGIGTGSAVLAWILFLCAYVTLIVTALNKAFSLIHVIPEKVIRWISGQPEGGGEAEALGEMKRGVESGIAGAKGGGEKAAAGGQKAGKAKAAQKKATSQQSTTVSGTNQTPGT